MQISCRSATRIPQTGCDEIRILLLIIIIIIVVVEVTIFNVDPVISPLEGTVMSFRVRSHRHPPQPPK